MREAGAFGLVEVLVALAIVTAALLPMLSMCGHGNRSAKHSEMTAQAAMRAIWLIDGEAARPWHDLAAAAGSGGSLPAAAVETSSGLEEELTADVTPEGLVVLTATVWFQLPGAGQQPRRCVTFRRVVARPDVSVVTSRRPDSV